jgi:ribosomal protein S18 acetylase RimI-like enzyme
MTIQQVVRTFSPGDAHAVAKLHQESIPGGFLSLLGCTFLEQLYKAIAKDKQSIVYVAESADSPHVIGFVAGTCDTSAMYKRILLKNIFSFSIILLPALFRPGFLTKITQTILYAKKDTKKTITTKHNFHAELLSIAVSAETRRQNTGKTLVESLENFLLLKNISHYKVVTVASDPRSNHFYEKVGFTLNKQFIHHENSMNEYVKRIV